MKEAPRSVAAAIAIAALCSAALAQPASDAIKGLEKQATGPKERNADG
jgi:hypothetical protein